MRIVYTRAALRDLETIATYLVPRNPVAAVHVADDVESAIDRLSDYPFSGRLQDEPGVRKSVSVRYRYRIFYTVDTDEGVVAVLSILHPSQNIG